MKRLAVYLALIGILTSCNAPEQAQKEQPVEKSSSKEPKSIEESTSYIAIDSDDALVATALLAAPEASRANCKVIGFNMAGEFVTFREGTNEFIVLTDNPAKEGFNAACYHKDLESFMARGRALRAEGKSTKEIFDIREEEAKAGTLDMGKPGATLHIYYGPETAYDPETAEVKGAHYRYVVYLPFATAESTGLPEKPVSSNHPWIMNPGTHRAHIMISPLADKSQ